VIKRHQLVWLNQSPVAIEPRAQKACDEWFESGLPFIATRQTSDYELRLGFCTPRETNDASPQRIGVVARKDSIARLSPPPLLAEAITQFKILKGIRDFAETQCFHLYGSYLWELLTEQPYTTPTSDLDLFIVLEHAQEIPGVIACFQKLDCRLPIRVDGEVSIQGLGEINWRELAASTETLLLKTTTGVRLINREYIPCPRNLQSA